MVVSETDVAEFIEEFIEEFLYAHGVVDGDGIHHRDGREFLVEVTVFALEED